MAWGIRLVLIAGSICTGFFVMRRIRKSRMHTEDTIFWIFFSLVLVLLGLIPEIAVGFSNLLGVQSPANLVWLVVIFLLIIKLFLQAQKLSRLQLQLTQLTQRYAIDQLDQEGPDGE